MCVLCHIWGVTPLTMQSSAWGPFGAVVIPHPAEKGKPLVWGFRAPLGWREKNKPGSGFAFSRCGSSLCTYLCSADIIANCGFCLETGTIAFVTTSPFLPKEMEFHLKTTFEKLAREIGQGQLHGLLVWKFCCSRRIYISLPFVKNRKLWCYPYTQL